MHGAPLIGCYHTLAQTNKRSKRKRGQRAAAALPVVLLDHLQADGFQRAHITLVSRAPFRQSDIMFTLHAHEILCVRMSVLEEETLRKKMLAFCMGLDARLGADSLVRHAMDRDLARLVWDQCALV